MITQFDKNQANPFFNQGWGNSVTNWITGIYSPSGTVKIGNTPNPGENGSCSFDINIDSLYQLLRPLIAAEFVSRNGLVKDVASKSDNTILANSGDMLQVNPTALPSSGGGGLPEGYTGTITSVPLNVGSTTWYYKNGVRQFNSAGSATYNGTQDVGGANAVWSAGILTYYGGASVTSKTITVTAGSYNFYFANGKLKSVNGSPW